EARHDGAAGGCRGGHRAARRHGARTHRRRGGAAPERSGRVRGDVARAQSLRRRACRRAHRRRAGARPRVTPAMRRLVPANFQDPFGLIARLVRSRDPAALFAIASTALAAVATPLDRALAISERRLYARAAAPQLPIVIVVGAPRSGTTVVSQVLAAHLPVTFFNNLTTVFPRAPIVANRLFRRLLRPPPP